MQIYFDSPEFDAQLLRALSYTYYHGADIGECLSTAAKIKFKDFNSWYEQWYNLAERLNKQAQESLANDCLTSAKQGFLRASNYYRTATYFLCGSPVDPRVVTAYEKHQNAFAQAISLFSSPVESVNIPYENSFLPGYFYSAEPHSTRPVLIINSGYDGTHQESYFTAGAAALSRGYHVLCFDGPGQGELLIKQKRYMRHDWEKVITPVVDYLLDRPDVDPTKMILLGTSWGGYLAPRAAAYDHRLAALVVNPGQFDALNIFRQALPEINALLENDPTHILGKFVSQAMSNQMFAAKMRAKLWVHGVESLIDLFHLWKKYNLEGVANLIRCPTLVMDSENEPFSSGQAKMLFDALTCQKEYALFTAKEGAGEHCEAGAISLAHQRLFDWLSVTLKIPAHDIAFAS